MLDRVGPMPFAGSCWADAWCKIGSDRCLVQDRVGPMPGARSFWADADLADVGNHVWCHGNS